MGGASRDAENVFGQVVDPVELTAAAGDEDTLAEIIEGGFVLEAALEQLERLAQPHMNNRV